jgi:hypothetical protein
MITTAGISLCVCASGYSMTALAAWRQEVKLGSPSPDTDVTFHPQEGDLDDIFLFGSRVWTLARKLSWGGQRRWIVRHVALLWIAALAAGCDGRALDTCLADRVTIREGVFGQQVSPCDTPGCQGSYGEGREIRVYDRDPTPPGQALSVDGSIVTDSGSQLIPRLTVAAVSRGFYEVPLPVGTYFLCALGRCVKVDVSANQPLLRYDCCRHPGGEWLTGTTCQQL